MVRDAAQLLQEAGSGPFTAPGAEAPFFTRDAPRHAACNRVKRQSAAGGVPLCRTHTGPRCSLCDKR